MSFNNNDGRYPNINPAIHIQRTRLHSDLNQQENEIDIHNQQPNTPLGLKLKMTHAFMLEIEHLRLDKKTQKSSSNDDAIMHVDEKLKISKFPIIHLQIGFWQKFSKRQGDLTAKMFFVSKQLIWEILEGSLKKKIEISWSNILAIRATKHKNGPTILEVVLNQAPLFRNEVETQPGKHPLWEETFDFTGGVASTERTHVLQIQPGILDVHYEKLLQSDPRLFELNRKPFPSQVWPYFKPKASYFSNLSFNRDMTPPYTHEPQYNAALAFGRDMNPSTPMQSTNIIYNHRNEQPFNRGLEIDTTTMVQPDNYNQNYLTNHVEPSPMRSHPDTSVLNLQATVLDDPVDELGKYLVGFIDKPVESAPFSPQLTPMLPRLGGSNMSTFLSDALSDCNINSNDDITSLIPR